MDQEQNKRADGLPLYARPHVLRRAREPKVERRREHAS